MQIWLQQIVIQVVAGKEQIMSKISLKIILVLVCNLFLSVGQAKELKGKIINFVQDDEGVKIILDSKSENKTTKESLKKQPQICYLRNDHVNFAQIMTQIQDWKARQAEVMVNSSDDNMPLIKEISELKK